MQKDHYEKSTQQYQPCGFEIELDELEDAMESAKLSDAHKEEFRIIFESRGVTAASYFIATLLERLKGTVAGEALRKELAPSLEDTLREMGERANASHTAVAKQRRQIGQRIGHML